MQILGASVIDDGISAVVQRSNRTVVSQWAARVLKRHVRRDLSLVKEVVGSKKEPKIIEAMQRDGLSDEVQQRILASWRTGDAKVFLHTKSAISAFLNKASDTLDWIESLPDSDRRIRRIERMSWKDAEDAAATWHEKLAKAKVDDNARMNGVVRVADLDSEMFMAKLVTDKALKAEGSMMGHCVGGYWNQVQSGHTNIFSLRDSEGYPHATIEMSKTPEVMLSDGSSVRVGRRPRPGVNYLHITDSNWVAVQVRGKQNKKPLEKYLSQIVKWFDDCDIPWVEYGQELPDARQDRRMFVFNVGGPQGLNFADPHEAHDVACNEMLRLAKSQSAKFSFQNAYRELGVASLHQHHNNPEIVQQFIDAVKPAVIESFKRVIKEGGSFDRGIMRSGVATLSELACKYKLDVEDINAALFDEICRDVEKVGYQKSKLLDMKNMDGGLDVIIHHLPLSPLFLLANGYANGKEEDVVNIIRPMLEGSLEIMKKYPKSLHLVQSSFPGVRSNHIKQAYLYCGLVSEFSSASEKVIAGVKARFSEVRLALKRARASDAMPMGEINLMRNMLSDGYEARLSRALTTKFGDGLAVAFESNKTPPVLKPAVEQSFKTGSMRL